ncbi:Cyclic nucleotide-binding domain-containing protein, partial [Dysosmobacter welbionis]
MAYLLFMGLALPLSILAASAAYQYTRRADLSLVLFAAFAALSLTVWADNWQLCWLNPCVWALSDDFSNFRIFRSVAWMRLTWLAALAGIWTVSYLCIRQYGKGLPGSLARSVRRAHRPIIALSLLACSGFAYAAQPLVDHSNPDQTVMDFYQVPYAENVVCTSRSAQVFPDTTAGTVSGTAAYRFRNTSGQAWTAAFGVNPGYTISNVRVNGAEVPFSVSDYQEYNEAMLEVALPSDREIELTMDYGGFPRENRNVSIMQGGTEISSEYLCL